MSLKVGITHKVEKPFLLDSSLHKFKELDFSSHFIIFIEQLPHTQQYFIFRVWYPNLLSLRSRRYQT
ncbi:hypothetical protein I79_013263 [Cricetulus griseus]|uniref:Uncharacterized protein n=1 Tax=Cricetulus griseus TaxID=10029 RepID=G3HR03_CRIGR|nr:hypothetical protein I79_013263 [Cricetulus griseus]